jgi:C4-dicarboxylate-specific signal transduction histidine kinase
MATDQQISHPSTQSKPSLNLVVILYGVIIVLAVAAGYLLYRNWQLNTEKEQELAALHHTASQNQLTNDQQQLTFGMKTFTWAVRNAMIQNKPGEINEYFNTLVKDRGVKEVLLIDPNGKVTISTNKKNQGIQFTSRFPAYLLQQQDVYFNNKKPYELSAPITAPNQRLGTLVMLYAPAPILPN